MQEGFRITRMYHPSFHAPDLDEVEAWFERVFGAASTNISETFKGRETGSYPTTYSTFTPMADVLMDTIAPTLYVLNGVQQYASVDKPHLKTIGWFAENSEGVYRSLRAAGIAMVDQYGKPAEGEEAPRSAGGTRCCPTSRSPSTTATRPAGRRRRHRRARSASSGAPSTPC